MPSGFGGRILEGCSVREALAPLAVVLEEDLESLRRTYSEEERVEFWNIIRRAYREYMLYCAGKQENRELVRLVKGNYRLAMLLLAASFKVNGEGQESIIRQFKEEEYRLLLDFEEFKIFDNLDIDTIVEFIKRREGKVYELVKKYYEKQYNALDTAWGPLMGDLLYAFEKRYQERRKKIEEAVVAYVRRYGLIETMSEIEDAIRKVLEAGELRRKIEEELRRKLREEYRVDELQARLAMLEEERNRLYQALSRIEEEAEGRLRGELLAELERVRREKEEIERRYREAEARLRALEEELGRARALLRGKEEELRRIVAEYASKHPGAAEAVEAEAEAIRSLVERLAREAEEYRRMLEAVTREKIAVEERLREVEAYLRGETRGRLVTREEAEGLAEAYLRRVAYKVSRGLKLFDPRSRRVVEISGWSEKTGYTVGEGALAGSRGLLLARKKGLISRRRDVVVEALVVLHRDALEEKGYDTRPVSLAEVLEAVKPRVEEAEQTGYYHVLAVASPTGFTDKAVEFIGSSEFHRNFASSNMTLYLVDLLSGAVYRNPSDPAAEANEWIVRPELPWDIIRKVMNYVVSEDTIVEALAASPSAPIVTAEKIMEATGVKDAALIRAALERLEQEGWGRVLLVQGITAFQYSEKAQARAGRG